jgi:hypothetical protein
MKEFHELGKKQKHKAMKEAKLTRRANAKEKGPHELSAQKMREKAYAHMKKHGG